ncbi:RluA family pseudouridine synthase [Apilactobacillus quenuiae]|uniref:RluA family pseudouridine synthase n=1 Tax=Apilactobacillus quenuiae TaxID=2008377 RepID=UPI000D01B6A4|nr:RluA family pseudouridine synthase [Apilactobacillus quenuiae]
MHKWQYQLIVKNVISPVSVRKYLSNYLLIPKHLIFSLRKNKRITVNGKYLPMNFNVKNNDHIEILFTANDFKLPVQNLLPDNSQKIKILFENKDLLVVNKKRGIKTHPNSPNETGTLLNFCESYLNKSKQHAYMIHRLDQETSGAIIVGKNPAVVPILVKLIKDKIIHRTYLAWVDGKFKQKSGIINLPIGLDITDKRKRQVNGTHAKKALTKYNVLKEYRNSSLVEINIQTGRTHQIRVHMNKIGHPIIGDPLYNENNSTGNMLLHSWKLKLIIPYYMNNKVIESPIPAEFNIM